MNSGFCKDGNEILFLVNTKTYDDIEGDESRFHRSCRIHDQLSFELINDFKLRRANIKTGYGFRVDIEFDENGTEEFRVYKVKYNKGNV